MPNDEDVGDVHLIPGEENEGGGGNEGHVMSPLHLG